MTLIQKVIKYFFRIIRPIQKTYWFLFRPKTRGVKCLVKYQEKFLLVRLNYAHNLWTLPGGGVKKKESFKDGAIREIKEEVGIGISNPFFIGRYENKKEYKNDMVEVYLVEIDNIDYKIDPLEIKEAGWYSIDNLPKDRASSLDKIFNFYDEYRISKSK